uniref:EF-hand domain-containing protein n=1 Tax=Spongospora subterranea TaxID=70186 RepID=A0A0H5QVP2_9EUKA|eukprot:CRZ05985.1 hypothetical protein [Spongospora subterranea]
MDLHRMFPNDFRIFCQLATESQGLYPVKEIAGCENVVEPVYTCLSEHSSDIRLVDWTQKNRNRQHCDLLPFLARVFYEQFRDESSPTNYAGLNGLSFNTPVSISTKIFGTTRALNMFKRSAAVGNQLKENLEKTEATPVFDREEVQALLSMFWKASAGRNTITRQELNTIFVQFDIDESAGIYFQRLFDPENSNAIDFDGFVETMSVLVRGSKQDHLDMLFKMFDFDKNGVIRAEEMFAMMECRWGQAIRDSLDNLLDAVVDKFNATDADQTVTNVCITRAEYDATVTEVPGFWVKIVGRIETIIAGRIEAARRPKHYRIQQHSKQPAQMA